MRIMLFETMHAMIWNSETQYLKLNFPRFPSADAQPNELVHKADHWKHQHNQQEKRGHEEHGRNRPAFLEKKTKEHHCQRAHPGQFSLVYLYKKTKETKEQNCQWMYTQVSLV